MAHLPDGKRVKFSFTSIQRWKVCDTNPWSIFFKYSFSESEPWKELKVRNKKDTPLMCADDIKQSFPEGRYVPEKKFIDLMDHLRYLKRNSSKDFYRSLPHDEILSSDDNESGPDTESDTDDEFLQICDQWLTEEEAKQLQSSDSDSSSNSDDVNDSILFLRN